MYLGCIDSTTRFIFLSLSEAVNSFLLDIEVDVQPKSGRYKSILGLMLQLLGKKKLTYYWCCQAKIVRCNFRAARN